MNKPNLYPKMTALARSFPTLDKAPVDPFDAERFDEWVCRSGLCHGGFYAARFVLAVWSGRAALMEKRRHRIAGGPRHDDGVDEFVFQMVTPWECGVFDIVDAMGTWDVVHRKAFLDWAREPWWP